MNKLFIGSLIFFLIISLHCYAQNNVQETEDNLVMSQVVINADKRNLEKAEIKQPKNEITLFKYSIDFLQPDKNIKQEYKFNIVKSFRSNIRFGGFWDKYAIVNFTPEINIKPFDFLSIYAINNMSFFVPINGIKENIRSMVLRSAAILAVDNSVKLFFESSRITGPVISFLTKNVLLYIINKIEKKTDFNNDLLNYNYQYYSLTIRF